MSGKSFGITRPRIHAKRRGHAAASALVPGGLALLALLTAALLLPTAASAAECTDTWTGPAEGTWQTAANWSTGKVPTSSDVVCIGSGKTVSVTTGSNEAQILQVEGTLVISGGSLTLSEMPSTVAKLQISGGVLTNSGEVFVSESFVANGGSMEGTGSTVIGSKVSGKVESAGGLTISKRTLVINGSLTVEGPTGQILAKEGASILNSGTLTVNGEGEGRGLVAGSGATPTLTNTGTVLKTSGSGITTVGLQTDNENTVHAETGTLEFVGGGTSGKEKTDSWLTTLGKATIVFSGSTFSLGENVLLLGNFELLNATTVTVGRNEPVNEFETYFTVVGSTLKVSATTGRSVFTELTTHNSTVAVSNGVTGLFSEVHLEKGEVTVGAGSSGFLDSYLYTSTQVETKVTVENSARVALAGVVEGGEVNIGEHATEYLSGLEFKSGSINIANNTTVSASGPSIFYLISGGLHFGEGTSGVLGSFIQKGGTATLGGGSTVEGYDDHLEGGTFSIAANAHFDPLWIEVAGGTVTTESAGELNAGQLFLKSGLMNGAGTLNVTELSWSGGTMSGTGSTVATGPGLIESGSSYVTLQERKLITQASFSLGKSTLKMSDGAVLENFGEFNASSEASGFGPQIQVAESSTKEPKIINLKEFNKKSGTGTTEITVPLENLGSIHQFSGQLIIKKPIRVPTSNHFGHHSCSHEPVDCATGDYSETQTDFAIGGRGIGLDLTRSYSAQAAATASSPGAFGYGWANSFSDHLVSEESGKKITLVQGDGGTVPFTESGKGSYTPAGWSQDTLSGTPETGYTLTLPEQTKYAFSGSGRLESVTDRNSNATTLSYNLSGRLETITDPAGRKITLTYNGEGLVEKAKDPMGHEVKYTYESKNLASVTMPGELSPRWQFKYDGSHRITTVTDGRGGKTTNEYDSSNRVTSQTDPALRTTTFEYTAFHTKITNKATGAVTDEWFTSNNEPYSITRGFGTSVATTETFTYNSEGRILSATDGNSHKTTYTYDSHGNRTSKKDAAEAETKWVYNETHDLETETTPSGEKTTIKRDIHGNPETISRPAPGSTTQTTSYTYNSHGQVETLTDPLKQIWKYEHDSAGNRTAEIDPEGDKRTWAYNEDSQVTSMVSPRGNATGEKPAEYTTSIELDAQGRPLKVTDPLSHETKYIYDANGNLESTTDPAAHKTKYTYNADNELTKTEKPNGNLMETEYDGAGQAKSQTDGNKHATTYVRNVLEEPTEVIDPLGRKMIQEYDAAGNLKKVTDPLKRVTTYVYDPANRLKEVSYSDGVTPTVKYEYSAGGDLTHMTDGTGELTLTYDQLDRLTERKDGHGNTVGYEYNLGNQQTKITYPNGKAVKHTFDNAGRLKTVVDWLGNTTTFTYNADSELRITTFPSTTSNVDEYFYSHNDRMSEVKLKKGAETLASQVYTRYATDNLKSQTSKGLPGAETASFTYDTNNRLTVAGASSFEYDAANNLTKAPGTTNTYDNASQLTKGTKVTYTYDEMGERTKTTPSTGPATTYGYDQAGNLTSVKRPKSGEVTEINDIYAYNGLRQLASRNIAGKTNYVTWDLTHAIPSILSDGQNSYIFGPGGEPVEQISSTETPTYDHHDQLGSTRMLTNSSGEAKATFSYGPYGASEGSTGTLTTPLGFAGQYTESDSGLQYLRARFYDPKTGQFLTRDPQDAITRAPYGYAGQDPLDYVDPLGQESFDPFSPGSWVNTAGEVISKVEEHIENETVREVNEEVQLVKEFGSVLKSAGSSVGHFAECALSDYVKADEEGARIISPALPEIIGCAGGAGYVFTHAPAEALAFPIPAAILGCAGGAVLGALDIPTEALPPDDGVPR